MLTVLKHELIHTYAMREKALGEESDGVRKHNDQLVRKNRRLYNAYRNVVNQLEDVAPAGLKLHIQDEASMQSDEASELETEQMHQLFQMRQQLQLTEQELSASQQRNLNDAEEHRRTVASLGQRIDMLGEELHQARLSHEQQIQPARVVLEQIQSDLVTLLRAFGPGHMSEGILARLLSQLDALRVNFERSGARGTAASPVRSVRSGSRSASPSANAFAEARDREIDALRAEADALRAEVEALRGQLEERDNFDTTSTRASPDAQISAAAQQEIEALRERLAAAQNRRASLAPGARAAQQAAQEEVESLRQKLLEAQMATKEVEMRAQFATKEVEMREAQKAAEVEALRERLAAAQNRRASLAPGARAAQQAAQEEVESLRKKLEESQMATKEVEQLRGSALRASADTQASLQRANDMLQRELDTVRRQLGDRDRELDTVRRQLEDRDRELDRLRGQLDSQHRELDTLRKHLEARSVAVRSTMTSVSPPRTGMQDAGYAGGGGRVGGAPYSTSPQKAASVWGHPFSAEPHAPEAMQHPMHAPIPPEVTAPLPNIPSCTARTDPGRAAQECISESDLVVA